jgi:hypothetical protein
MHASKVKPSSFGAHFVRPANGPFATLIVEQVPGNCRCGFREFCNASGSILSDCLAGDAPDAEAALKDQNAKQFVVSDGRALLTDCVVTLLTLSHA